MANIFPVGRYFVAQPAQNGDFAILGNAADSRVGTWVVGFVPSADFVGAFGIVGRVTIPPAENDLGDDTTYVSIPYRRVTLAGVASDYALVSAAVGGTRDIIQIPANGMDVGLLIAASAGTCAIISWPLNGPSTF